MRGWLLGGSVLWALSCVSAPREPPPAGPEVVTFRAPSPEARPAAVVPDAAAPEGLPAEPPAPPTGLAELSAPVRIGPAGAVRHVPGPSAAPDEKPDTVPFDGVRAPLQRAMKRVRRCYENALKSDPNLKGKVSARLVFDAEGRVTYAEVKENSGVDDALARCMAEALRQITIAPGEAGREVTVPFVLVPHG